ncbi:MAG: histidinol dehydrogenase [Gammaproteobacteria bacterium]|nr:histidinol dehydrogenase [Gammaproteobacteria bacterium]
MSNWNTLAAADQRALLQRPVSKQSDLQASVAAIIRDVREQGDKALLAYAKRLDGLRSATFTLDTKLVNSIAQQIDPSLRQAIDEAYVRIRSFHELAKPQDFSLETAPGVTCASRYRGYEQIGLYIPGGSAPLISTVLMLGVPAQISGVDNISLCTPLQQHNELHPGIAYAASKCGVTAIFALGGAQAIAAMAYGTETVPGSQKIFGPGNSWVTEAKQQIAFDPRGAAIDMPAGPSEVLVIADARANPDFVAIDLLSQAEHGPDSQAIVISDSQALLNNIDKALDNEIKILTRQDILSESKNNIRLILVDSLQQALTISNDYAPEHLILQSENAETLADNVKNAGSVFIGAWAPESLGDYCSGTNHVLPTYGFARSYNGLSTIDFMQKITFQKVSPQGIQNIGPCAMKLAHAEGLDAHKRAVEIRLNALAAKTAS